MSETVKTESDFMGPVKAFGPTVKFAEWDADKHPRGPDGKFISGANIGSQILKLAAEKGLDASTALKLANLIKASVDSGAQTVGNAWSDAIEVMDSPGILKGVTENNQGTLRLTRADIEAAELLMTDHLLGTPQPLPDGYKLRGDKVHGPDGWVGTIGKTPAGYFGFGVPGLVAGNAPDFDTKEKAVAWTIAAHQVSATKLPDGYSIKVTKAIGHDVIGPKGYVGAVTLDDTNGEWFGYGSEADVYPEDAPGHPTKEAATAWLIAKHQEVQGTSTAAPSGERWPNYPGGAYGMLEREAKKLGLTPKDLAKAIDVHENAPVGYENQLALDSLKLSLKGPLSTDAKPAAAFPPPGSKIVESGHNELELAGPDGQVLAWALKIGNVWHPGKYDSNGKAYLDMQATPQSTGEDALALALVGEPAGLEPAAPIVKDAASIKKVGSQYEAIVDGLPGKKFTSNKKAQAYSIGVQKLNNELATHGLKLSGGYWPGLKFAVSKSDGQSIANATWVDGTWQAFVNGAYVHGSPKQVAESLGKAYGGGEPEPSGGKVGAQYGNKNAWKGGPHPDMPGVHASEGPTFKSVFHNEKSAGHVIKSGLNWEAIDTYGVKKGRFDNALDAVAAAASTTVEDHALSEKHGVELALNAGGGQVVLAAGKKIGIVADAPGGKWLGGSEFGAGQFFNRKVEALAYVVSQAGQSTKMPTGYTYTETMSTGLATGYDANGKQVVYAQKNTDGKWIGGVYGSDGWGQLIEKLGTFDSPAAAVAAAATHHAKNTGTITAGEFDIVPGEVTQVKPTANAKAVGKYLAANPGKTGMMIANALGIQPKLANDAVDELIASGDVAWSDKGAGGWAVVTGSDYLKHGKVGAQYGNKNAWKGGPHPVWAGLEATPSNSYPGGIDVSVDGEPYALVFPSEYDGFEIEMAPDFQGSHLHGEGFATVEEALAKLGEEAPNNWDGMKTIVPGPAPKPGSLAYKASQLVARKPHIDLNDVMEAFGVDQFQALAALDEAAAAHEIEADTSVGGWVSLPGNPHKQSGATSDSSGNENHDWLKTLPEGIVAQENEEADEGTWKILGDGGKFLGNISVDSSDGSWAAHPADDEGTDTGEYLDAVNPIAAVNLLISHHGLQNEHSMADPHGGKVGAQYGNKNAWKGGPHPDMPGLMAIPEEWDSGSGFIVEKNGVTYATISGPGNDYTIYLTGGGNADGTVHDSLEAALETVAKVAALDEDPYGLEPAVDPHAGTTAAKWTRGAHPVVDGLVLKAGIGPTTQNVYLYGTQIAMVSLEDNETTWKIDAFQDDFYEVDGGGYISLKDALDAIAGTASIIAGDGPSMDPDDAMDSLGAEVSEVSWQSALGGIEPAAAPGFSELESKVLGHLKANPGAWSGDVATALNMEWEAANTAIEGLVSKDAVYFLNGWYFKAESESAPSTSLSSVDKPSGPVPAGTIILAEDLEKYNVHEYNGHQLGAWWKNGVQYAAVQAGGGPVKNFSSAVKAKGWLDEQGAVKLGHLSSAESVLKGYADGLGVQVDDAPYIGEQLKKAILSGGDPKLALVDAKAGVSDLVEAKKQAQADEMSQAAAEAAAEADWHAKVAAIGPIAPVKPSGPLPALGLLDKPSSSAALKDRIMELVDQGYSAKEIATAFGIKSTYVSDHASRTRADRKKALAALEATKASGGKVGAQYGNKNAWKGGPHEWPSKEHLYGGKDLTGIDPTWTPEPGKKVSFGAVIFNEEGKVLLRRPTGAKSPDQPGFGGAAWTFAKGGAKDGQSPLTAAKDEVGEETGYTGVAVGTVPGSFAGTTTSNHYFIMKATGHNALLMDNETEQVVWVTPEEAVALIAKSDKTVAARDHAVLAAALQATGHPSAMTLSPAASEPTVGFPASPDGATVIKKLGGSTGAELVEINGVKYVRKRGKDAAHVRAEVEADALYRAAGLDAPRSRIYETPQGPVKLAEYVQGVEIGKWMATASPAQQASVKAKLQAGFAADALMANHDVIGMNADNVMVTSDGRVMRIDNGGSMDKKATGSNKDAGEWTDHPTDLWSMRDPSKSPQGAKYFGSIQHDQMVEQCRQLLNREKVILSAATNEDRRARLEARLDSMRRMVKASDAMKKDNFKEGHRASFAKHQVHIGARTNIHKALPKLLKSKQGNSVIVVDENGKEFNSCRADIASYQTPALHYKKAWVGGSYGATKDSAETISTLTGVQLGIITKNPSGTYKAVRTADQVTKMFDSRAQAREWLAPAPNAQQAGGSGKYVSHTDEMAKYMATQGADQKIIASWMAAHGGDPNSSYSRALRYYYANQTSDNPEKDYHWIGGYNEHKKEWEKLVSNFGEKKVIESLTAYHAFNYDFLSRVPIAGKSSPEKGTVTLTRSTGSGEVPPGTQHGDTNVKIKGAMVSSSLMKRIFKSKTFVHRTEVPHHLVFGMYFMERTPGSKLAPFLGEDENEFVYLQHPSLRYTVHKNIETNWP